MQSVSDAQYFSPSVVVVVCAIGVGDFTSRMNDIRNTNNIGITICACAISFTVLRFAILIYPVFV